ncbi:SDR family oxidoreductase [Streptomyces sp. NPDC048045]|uniref:SDR family oxidoreductase n=1 Tax=Streptomyces sp. NPDC048045 TaxID=3154710 RepID=UPI0034153E50
MTFLVTAATGRTSSGVVRHLRAAGEDVRVLVRNREKAQSAFSDLDGIEIVDGAFDDGAVLAKAFNGVDVTFLTIGGNPDQVRLEKAIIVAAAKADRPHVVKLSSVATSHDSALLPGRQHAEIEDHLAASGLPHTLLRPVSFTDNLLYAAESVAAHNGWAGAAPTGRVAYIDIRDVSEAAALVLRDPTLHGRTHDWSGPDAYTFPEAAALLSKILGREIRYVPVSADERRSALLGAGLAEWYAELFVSLDTAAEAGALQAVSTTLKELLGREPRTVEEFLTENATQFTK